MSRLKRLLARFAAHDPHEPVDPPALQEERRAARHDSDAPVTTGAIERLQATLRATPATLKRIDLETGAVGAMDESDAACGDGIKGAFRLQNYGIPEEQVNWYASFGFIGHQMCAMIAQHWLVSKACWMPGEDAVRNGYEVVRQDGKPIDPSTMDQIRQADERYGIRQTMEEFIGLGRVFGIRIALFVVDSEDPDYYKKPFNPDGCGPGKYRGVSMIDPVWITPELSTEALANPMSRHFFEPTYWRVSGTLIHRSHLVIYRTKTVPDLLKPTYQYGGVPLPQRIAERVYAAERTANEAPLLAMTKRLIVVKVSEEAMTKPAKLRAKLAEWMQYISNFGTKVISGDEEISQTDTALTDLDAVIMTQYQIVAAIAEVPATKLMGTSPKGFGASGEYEQTSYAEKLEGEQTKCTPLLRRHHQLLIRSEISPDAPFATSVSWLPVDSPTASEWADINLKKAQTDQALQTAGAIDQLDIRNRVANDRDSGYSGIEQATIDDTVTTEVTSGLAGVAQQVEQTPRVGTQPESLGRAV